MLSVVIPTFNESKNIRNLVTQIDKALKGIEYEIVFIDDSKDNTPDVIREVAKDFPAVRRDLNLLRVSIWLVWMLIYSTHLSY